MNTVAEQKSRPGVFLGQKPLGKIVSFILIASSGNVAIIGATLVLIWRKIVKVPFRNLGLYAPKSWLKTIVLGVLLGIFIKLLFATIIMPLMGSVPSSSSTFSFLKGNLTNALLFSVYVLVVAGFAEEIIFRGYLFHQLEDWFGNGKLQMVLTVVVSSLIFGIPHLYQGGFGVIQSILVGMIYGAVYLANKKNLWLVMIAHATFDWVAIYIIYMDWSIKVNTFFF